MDSLLAVDALCVVLALCMVRSLVLRKRVSWPLPPGPKPRFLVGNLADLPPSGKKEWLHWSKHGNLYGPISSVTCFGQTLILLNDQRVAFELLEKRSLLHSSRPKMTFGGEMVGWANSMTFQQYTEEFRSHRRKAHIVLGSKDAVSAFNELLDVETRRFLLRTLQNPEMLVQHIRTEAGAIILKIAYGYTIEPNEKDPLVDLADEALLQFSLSAVPGAWIVDMLPFLKFVPDWLPGMGFKRTAAEWRKTLTDLVEKPYGFVRQQMAAGIHRRSYVSIFLEKGISNSEEESIVKWGAATLYAGGADTTVSALASFFLAMMLYPEVQRKAQEEIDLVVGNDRLPSIEDREQLPYIDAIVKEVLRWHPIGPMGLPHTSTEDDTYEGYFIPKDAILLANIWAFTHDAGTYHDPAKFKPERFLAIDGREPELDPHTLSFGFGRRVCPGRELADASVYLTIAQSLAVFNISKPVENGQIIEPDVDFTPGTISHPVPFKADMKPRSPKAETLVKTVQEEFPFSKNDARTLRDLKV